MLFAKAQPISVTNTPKDTTIAHPSMTMTVEDIIKELHISRKTAYELARQNDFPSFRIGNRILINRKGLQCWIDEQCRKEAF